MHTITSTHTVQADYTLPPLNCLCAFPNNFLISQSSKIGALMMFFSFMIFLTSSVPRMLFMRDVTCSFQYVIKLQQAGDRQNRVLQVK